MFLSFERKEKKERKRENSNSFVGFLFVSDVGSRGNRYKKTQRISGEHDK